MAISRSGPAWCLSIAYLLAGAVAASAAPAVSATQTGALAVDNNGNGIANQGDTIRYTIRIENAGDADAVNAAIQEFLDANTTLVPGSVMTSPVARDDAYSTPMRQTLNVPATGVLANDNDADGDLPEVVSVSPVSDQGVTVSMLADGSFSYQPPAMFSGEDAFTYVIGDDDGFTNDARVVVTVVPGAVCRSPKPTAPTRCRPGHRSSIRWWSATPDPPAASGVEVVDTFPSQHLLSEHLLPCGHRVPQQHRVQLGRPGRRGLRPHSP